jgi:RNA polymerase sigma-70 factor (ECF subfamily)
MSPSPGETPAPAFFRSFVRGGVGAAPSLETFAGDEQRIREALERQDWDGALSALMDAYGQRVYRYCLHMMRDAQLAEDALQETFVRAHQSLHAFRGGSSLRTWIHAIAHNRCLDALKAERRRHQRIESTDDPPEYPDTAPGPEFQLAATEMAATLRRCLDRLSTPVKAAVLARHQEGLTYLEMSAVLGARPAALERKVARAMPALRRCLEREGIRL